MSDSSRRVRYSEKRTRRPQGGRDVYGEHDDQGKWVRCGYCGFINNRDTTDHGGATALSGVNPVIFSPTVYDKPQPMSISFQGMEYVLPKASQAGTAAVVRDDYMPEVARFCAFCGSPNWYQ